MKRTMERISLCDIEFSDGYLAKVRDTAARVATNRCIFPVARMTTDSNGAGFEKWGDFNEKASPWNKTTWSDWTDFSACW